MRRIGIVLGSVAIVLTSAPSGGMASGRVLSGFERQAASTRATLCATGSSRLTAREMKTITRIVALRAMRGFGIKHTRVARAGSRCISVQAPSRRIGTSVLATLIRRGYLALTDSGVQAFKIGTKVKIVCRKAGCAPHTPVGRTNLGARPPIMRIVIPDNLVVRGSARVGTDTAGYPTVTYGLRPRGARLWCAYTSKHVERYAAIVLDNQVLADPMIQSAICGSETQISGLASRAAAQRIAIFLNYGPLPVGLRVRSIGRVSAVS